MPNPSTLAQRMAQAQEATRARRAAASVPASAPAPATLARAAPAAPSAAPPVAPRAAAAAAPPVPAKVHDAPWQLPGRSGQHLVLMPGQMHFGGQVASLRTLLGSCVAVTLWHPQRRIGGMCHYLLPDRARKPGEPSDGRYGNEALEAMVEQILRTRTQPADYHAHLYGGADTMPEGTGLRFNVGERNIEQGWSLIDRFGFQLQGVDVGEDVPRTVTLTLATGEVEMKRGTGRAPALALPAAALARR